MPWTSDFKLADAPLVLAGPILRQASQTSVTVWFALKDPALVKLTVAAKAWFARREPPPAVPPPESHDVEYLVGEQSTRMIGPNLHIVAVTATVPEGRDALPVGGIYCYDAHFLAFPLPVPPQTLPPATYERANLAAATNNALLSYGNFGKPSFSLPPLNRKDLRIMHGSCRKPHDVGPDALAILDDLIEASATQRRPHQLILTGDQIYGDDVSAALLMMIGSAAKGLMGEEKLLSGVSGPIDRHRIDAPFTAAQLPPIQRSWLVTEDRGFSTSKGQNHLLFLGEYICMYLFAWSDELWKVIKRPTQAEIEAAAASATSLIPDAPGTGSSSQQNYDAQKINLYADFQKRAEAESAWKKPLDDFRATLPKVRRALANIPTYMVLGSHDVTGKFNTSRTICEKMYATDFGCHVVQNALLAYALCQHWGNDPEAFRTSPEPKIAGAKLLDLVENNETYLSKHPRLRTLLGVHGTPELERQSTFAVFHDVDHRVPYDSTSLAYDYVVEGPDHQILVTDTRTWRAFPRTDMEAQGEFLPAAQLWRQIQSRPATNGRALIVALSANAPPVRALRCDQFDDELAADLKIYDLEDDRRDNWAPGTPFYDRFLRAISDRLPLVPVGETVERRGAITLLCGGVRMGTTSRTVFDGATRFEERVDGAHPTKFVVANLSSGSLTGCDNFQITMHRDGHNYPAHILGPARVEGFAGWNTFDKITFVYASRPTSRPGEEPGADWAGILKPKTFPAKDPRTAGYNFKTPHYRYRLDYLTTFWPLTRETPLPGVIIDVDIADLGAARSAAQRLLQVHAPSASVAYSSAPAANGRQVVGVSNIGEVRFPLAQSDLAPTIEHTLHWRDITSGMMAKTQYEIRTDPTEYAMDVATPS